MLNCEVKMLKTYVYFQEGYLTRWLGLIAMWRINFNIIYASPKIFLIVFQLRLSDTKF